MKLCPKCNNELCEEDRFCSKCGLNLYMQDSGNMNYNNVFFTIPLELIKLHENQSNKLLIHLIQTHNL